MNNVIIKVYIEDIVSKFGIKNKLYRQVNKLRNGIFDKGLGFEKIEVENGVCLYSFRIDLHFRAYLRKENGTFIIFDVNKHNYKSILKKLKSN